MATQHNHAAGLSVIVMTRARDRKKLSIQQQHWGLDSTYSFERVVLGEWYCLEWQVTLVMLFLQPIVHNAACATELLLVGGGTCSGMQVKAGMGDFVVRQNSRQAAERACRLS